MAHFFNNKPNGLTLHCDGTGLCSKPEVKNYISSFLQTTSMVIIFSSLKCIKWVKKITLKNIALTICF